MGGLAVPAGPIRTPRPGGQPFVVGWERARPLLPLFERAAAEFGFPHPAVLVGMGLVESDLTHERGGRVIERWDAFPQDGPSVGIMQVKPRLWGGLVPGADPYTVEGNVRIGAALMARFARELGSWQRAIAERYHPADDAGSGTTRNAYVACIEGLVAEMGAARSPASGPGPAPADPWRPYPWPKMVDLVVPKPYDGAGFDRVEFRRPLIRGFCRHITDGPTSQTIEFFRDFFGTGGARARDALTDLVIGYDGRIGLLNDWRDPERGGTRAGWANGGVDGLEGEGVAFYRRYPRINVHLLSAEHCCRSGDAWSDAMIAATIEVGAANAQELKIPWDRYPYHPGFGGVSVEQQHRNFATKSCPAEPYISKVAPMVLRETKAKLRLHQAGSANPGGGVPTPPVPPKLEPVYPFGFGREQVAHYFGTLPRYGADGEVLGEAAFDPAGPISLAWLGRAAKEGRFPEAEEWRVFRGRDFVTFEGGWVLHRPTGADGRADWRWIDSPAASAAAA